MDANQERESWRAISDLDQRTEHIETGLGVVEKHDDVFKLRTEKIVRDKVNAYFAAVAIIGSIGAFFAIRSFVTDIATSRATQIAEIEAKQIALDVTSDRVVDDLLRDPNFVTTVLTEGRKEFEGAVVAFIDTENEENNRSCPDNWGPWEKAEGRILIGVGASEDDVDAAAQPLLQLSPAETGGVVEHRLTPAEMPRHQHDYKDRHLHDDGRGRAVGRDGGDGGADDLRRTDPAGGTDTDEWDAHENMPPYVAVRFCVRVGASTE